MTSSLPVVVAVTGASGAFYAVRLLQALSRSEVPIHLTISPSGGAVIRQELGLDLDVRKPDLRSFLGHRPHWSSIDPPPVDLSQIAYHEYDNYMTPIASGSFRTRAMVVCPCSGSTLSGIARAAASNLIQRAAEVHLKEHRKLVLVPREMPLSTLQLENMHRLSAAGAIIAPAMPGWYHGVTSLDSLVDFVVCRVLDLLDIDNTLMRRWGENG